MIFGAIQYMYRYLAVSCSTATCTTPRSSCTPVPYRYMYRTYVACKYGRLGKGVRVTIEDCVIAEIRSRFRAPECDCSLDAIATCTEHGYRSHKSSEN